MRALSVVACGILSVLAACSGGAQSLPEASHDDFRAIQREEAALAEARAAAQEQDDCAAACAAADRARAAADRLCAVAERVSDADARGRCRLARDEDREIQALADRECDCAQ